MRFLDLAIGVLHDVGAVAVQHAHLAGGQRCGVLAAVHALARRFDADQAHVFIGDVGMEDAHGVRAAAHSRHDVVGLAADGFRHLRQAFVADDGLEVAHHAGIGVGTRYRADDVERVFDVGDPVAHGFVQRVLQGARTGSDRHHRGAQQLHAVDVRRLAADVFAAHVHHAFHAVAGRHRGRGHAVLAGAGFGDDARLAHALGQEGLADAVVHLVRAAGPTSGGHGRPGWAGRRNA
ncbi:hypothetical protein G6F57_019089 [Rhizopus arrhizus]|nr:hypothetical protein G6F57_019089 [Rhizopus arrhizus]